ncbi:MAG TPA: ATP synthase subunit C [Spirochaetia bacterium]|nr:ATP synthase subunit C [Spirochaetales bacterium]HRY81055.1 ATP synthase subunit C [Spirochaetia bacterium]HRZ89054.1 ATP synthase subunit C [Spirochaetia bacterium]
MQDPKKLFAGRVRLSVVVLMAFLGIFGLVSVGGASAQTPESRTPQVTREQADIQKFGLIAAAVAFGFGAIGAGIAIANVGAAAMGAIGEKPEIASQALIFIALAEGLVVFGFITALMILGKF